jgi:hypothetical protein
MEQEFDDLMKSIIVKKAPANFTSKTIQHISINWKLRINTNLLFLKVFGLF